MTKLGIYMYLDLKRIWNPIDFQGQRSRSQGLIFGEGIHHALRCPCYHSHNIDTYETDHHNVNKTLLKLTLNTDYPSPKFMN